MLPDNVNFGPYTTVEHMFPTGENVLCQSNYESVGCVSFVNLPPYAFSSDKYIVAVWRIKSANH